MPSAEVPESPFRRLGERARYDAGFFDVVTATFVGPNGFTFEREVVRHPGAVCIVPLESDHRSVLMIRQYRGAVGATILELPAGKRDVPDEDPALCAGRELVEEVGREASSMKEIARFYNTPGFSDEETICFLAEGLREVPRQAHGVEEEHIVIERVSLGDVEDLMAAGDLVDAKSIIGLMAARHAVGWTTRAPGVTPRPLAGVAVSLPQRTPELQRTPEARTLEAPRTPQARISEAPPAAGKADAPVSGGSGAGQ
jgi:ADP-ribose pyrophosphatase